MGNDSYSLGLQLHTGATANGNISGWSGLQLHSGATSVGNVEESGEIAFCRRSVHIGHFGGKCRISSSGNVKESGEFAFFPKAREGWRVAARATAT